MKTVLIIAVMFVLALTTYVVADQTILSGGYHNIPSRLSISSPEVCAYCHIPHRANTTSLPLGNRIASNPTAFCETCHAGTNITTGLLRNPLSGTLTGGSIATSSNAYIAADTHIVGGVNHPAGTVSGTDYGWSGDGPAGKVNSFAGLQVPTYATSALKTDINDSTFSIASGETIHCTDCHYVHRGGSSSDRAFLRRNNSNSALCTSCHNL